MKSAARALAALLFLASHAPVFAVDASKPEYLPEEKPPVPGRSPLSPAERAKPQYQHGDILIPASSRDEPKRPVFSAALAENYLRNGALAWKRNQDCVSCHTTGTYMVTRPAMAAQLGRPLDEMRDFFVTELRAKQKMARVELAKPKTVGPAQAVYLAAGLAEWDKHIAKRLSPETAEALALMFEVQDNAGSWASQDGWPPLESDSFHLATQAAMAVGTAPGWLAGLQDGKQASAVRRLKTYLRETAPPHDYSRTLLLWAATRMPDLLPPARTRELVEMLWRQQRSDGGWSIRTFATPEQWGRGNRAGKLRAEEEFADPPSDGHQTGLAIVVLREAGVPADDGRIQRGIRWLKENQRESGRWWTRSLNTDNRHFINYSGTAYPMLALALCGELPAPAALAYSGGK